MSQLGQPKLQVLNSPLWQVVATLSVWPTLSLDSAEVLMTQAG